MIEICCADQSVYPRRVGFATGFNVQTYNNDGLNLHAASDSESASEDSDAGVAAAAAAAPAPAPPPAPAPEPVPAAAAAAAATPSCCPTALGVCPEEYDVGEWAAATAKRLRDLALRFGALRKEWVNFQRKADFQEFYRTIWERQCRESRNSDAVLDFVRSFIGQADLDMMMLMSTSHVLEATKIRFGPMDAAMDRRVRSCIVAEKMQRLDKKAQVVRLKLLENSIDRLKALVREQKMIVVLGVTEEIGILKALVEEMMEPVDKQLAAEAKQLETEAIADPIFMQPRPKRPARPTTPL